MFGEEWVRLAVSKDKNRPNINRIYADDGMLVATDGWRLHATSKGEKYPDVKSMIEKIANREDAKTIVLDANNLREALPKTGEVVLRLVDYKTAIEVYWKSGTLEHYALVMPTREGEASPEIKWRPLGPPKEVK